MPPWLTGIVFPMTADNDNRDLAELFELEIWPLIPTAELAPAAPWRAPARAPRSRLDVGTLVLDSSAVVTVIHREDGYRHLLAAMEEAAELAIATPTLLQATALLVGRLGPLGRLVLARFLEEAEVQAVPFDQGRQRIAARAFVRFGDGRHPAALTSTDCAAYATARLAGAPLLYAGKGFPLTDIAIAGT